MRNGFFLGLLTIFCLIFLTGTISAAWTDTLGVNLEHYYDMETKTASNLQDEISPQANFTMVNSPTNVSGIINSGVNVTGTQRLGTATINPDSFTEFTWSIWIYKQVSNSKILVYGEDSGFGLRELELVSDSVQMSIGTGATTVTISDPSNIADNTWTHIVVTAVEGGEIILYVNGTEVDSDNVTAFGNASSTWYGGSNTGGNERFAGRIDELGYWSRNVSLAEVTQLYNGGAGITYIPPAVITTTVTLVSPTTGFSINSTGSNFTANYSSSTYNFTNSTYYIWNSNGSVFNTTFVSISPSNDTNSTLFIDAFLFGSQYIWNVYACYQNNTFTNCTFSTNGNFTFSVVPFSVLTTNYTPNVYETSYQNFIINISANSQVNSITGSFWYNQTEYPLTLNADSGGLYSASKNIDIPIIDSNGNNSFLWNFRFTLNDASVISSNTSLYYQNVNKTYLVACNETINTQFLNFTTHSATNPYPKINASFKSSWDWWIGHGNFKRNYSYEDISETNSSFTFCLFPSDKTYYVNTQLDTDAAAYSPNNYYLDNATITNTTNAIDLYLLNDSLATVTVLKVVDKSQVPMANILIQIQYYDVGTDKFYMIAMAKTSYDGQDIAYLNWYNSLYKFIFIQNGTVVKTIDPYKISETPQTYTIDEGLAYTFTKFRDFAYSLYYNNATQNFVLTFTKPSGLVDTGCLRVIKRTPLNDTTICQTCESSSSATIYCNIASYGNGTYIATFYATGSFFNLASISQKIGGDFSTTIHDLLGNDDATFYALLFSVLIVSLMFVSLPLGIVGILLSIGAGSALGFSQLNYMIFSGIVIIGGVIIWIIKR